MVSGTMELSTGGCSPVHRLDPRTKAGLVACLIVATVSTPPNYLAVYVAYAGLICCAAALAHLPLKVVLGRALAVLPFSVFAALWMPLQRTGPQWQIPGLSVTLSVHGMWLLWGVVAKSILGAAALVWLAATTRFTDFLTGLRAWHAPGIIVDVLGLTYRYLFVLVDEAGRLRRAAAARGYRPRWIGQAVLIGRLTGQLFLRAYERAERVHFAMRLRGYSGQMPTGNPPAFTARDVLAVAVGLPLIVLIRGVLR